MESGRVSIIIPSYNDERYISEAVESALAQTYQNCEVIVVDCSTDGTLKVLERYADRITIVPVAYCYTAGALNEGIRRMSGEWFKFLCADDRLHPNCVGDLVEAATTAQNPHDCVFYGDFDLIDDAGEVVLHERHNLGEMSMFQQNVLLMSKQHGNANTLMIHRQAFVKHGGFDESFVMYEDHEMLLRLCVVHGFRMAYVPANLAQYRIHDGQVSGTRADRAAEVIDTARRRVYEQIGEKKASEYRASIEAVSSYPLTHRCARLLWCVLKRVIRNRRFVLRVRVAYALRRRRGMLSKI